MSSLETVHSSKLMNYDLITALQLNNELSFIMSSLVAVPVGPPTQNVVFNLKTYAKNTLLLPD